MQASPDQQNLIFELQLLDNEIMQANTKLKSLPEIEQLLHIDKRITLRQRSWQLLRQKLIRSH